MARTNFLRSEEATINFGQSGTVERCCGRVPDFLWDSKSASFRALALACCSESKSVLMTCKVMLFPQNYRIITTSCVFSLLTSLSAVVDLEPAWSLQPLVSPGPS